MLLFLTLAADKCDSEHKCIHGVCNFLNTCTCEGNYGGSYCDYCQEQYTGENCSECAEGFVWATEMGKLRCVNPNCIGSDNISCSSHGDCHKDKEVWGCRCVRHYDAASNCSKCSRQHYEVDVSGTLQCIHQACLDKAHQIVCSNNGYCSLIEIPLILPAKCHCTVPNMDSMCSACAKGYMEYNHTVDYNGTVVVDKTYCKFNFCGDTADCSGDSSRCRYTSSTDQYQCYCPDNYDFRTYCATCTTGFDIETNCTTCLNDRMDPKSSCTQCIFGYSLDSNCTACLPNYDPSTNCTSCLTGHTMISRCTQCEVGFSQDGNGVCVIANKGSNAAWISLGVIAGVVVLGVAAFFVVFYVRKRRSSKLQNIGNEEDDVLMQAVDQ